MTRPLSLLVLSTLAVMAAPALAPAQERPPEARAPRPSRPSEAAPRTPPPHAPSAAPPGSARSGGFAGYGPYERAFPGGVRPGGASGARPQVGGLRVDAFPRAGGGPPAPRPQGEAARDADPRGFAASAPGYGRETGDRGAAGYASGPRTYGAARRGGYGAGGGFSYRGREYARFRAAPFRFPRGYAYRTYARGQYLPRVFLYDDVFLDDYADFYLAPPPGPEYRWVRYGPDALLVDVDTGEVVDAAYGVFDDGGSYGDPAYAPGYGPGYGYDDGAPPRDGRDDNGGADGYGGYGPPPR